MNERRVFLVRSERMGWSELHAMLSGMAGVQVVDDVTDHAEALRRLAAASPDLVIAADRSADESNLSFLTEVRRLCPNSRTVVIASQFASPEAVIGLYNLPVQGMLIWHELTAEGFANEINTVLYTDATVTCATVARILREAVRAPAPPVPPDLDDRLRRVLLMLQAGRTHKAIAAEVHFGEHTVGREIAKLKELLGAESLVDLGVQAAKRGLL